VSYTLFAYLLLLTFLSHNPIQTYSGQATLKPNLLDAEQHAIIYTGFTIPPEYFYVTVHGDRVSERLTKRPIRVKSEQPDAEGTLDPLSRLNYGKIYTVEHYVRVLNIGMVHRDSMKILGEDCVWRRAAAVPRAKTKD